MQWNTEYAIQRVSKTKPRPNPRRDNKELMKMRKKLETAKDQTEKIHLKDRIRIIREHSYNNQASKKKVEVIRLKRQENILEKM